MTQPPQRGFRPPQYGPPPQQQRGPWGPPQQRGPWGPPQQRPGQWGQVPQGQWRGPQQWPPPQQGYRPQQPPQGQGQGPYRQGPPQFSPGLGGQYRPGGPFPPRPQGGPQYHQSYPWPPQQPPKKQSGRMWWIALPIVVVALMVGFSALTGGDDTAGPDTPWGDPTPTPSSEPTPGNDTDPDPEPEPDPEPAGYVNDDYRVPDVGAGPSQILDTQDDPSYLDRNAFYAQEVPLPVRCEAAEVDDVRDQSQLQSRMSDLTTCLTRVYGPPLEAAGFQAYQPRTLVYGEAGGSSPCGELEPVGAFYCPANQGIYLSSDLYRLTGDSVTAIDYVMAHEYSHNVQGRSGISVQRIYEQMDAATEVEAAAINRRLETQADCFAGTALNSLSQSLGYTQEDAAIVVDMAAYVGDDPNEEVRTHGIPESRVLWLERGLVADTYATCNSFSAPDSEVR